jgi:NhaP-type Na+/H+ or K+/H+ antiporter
VSPRFTACLTPTDPVIRSVYTVRTPPFLTLFLPQCCHSGYVQDHTNSSPSLIENQGGKYAVKHVPLNLRRILSAESAANDGLAYPFLTICLFLTVNPSTPNALAEWFVIGWLYQVIMGTVLGTIIGICISHMCAYYLSLARHHFLETSQTF